MPIAAATNIAVLLIFSIAAATHRIDSVLYYYVAQEDRFLEWFTFWAFVGAGIVFARNAVIDRARRGGLPWFAVGLGLFCLLVGLEEISWGQRLFGYMPPDYFLEENFQQEFNVHNIIDTDLRMLAMHAVLLGYGLMLALLARIPPIGRMLLDIRVVAPPVSLVPAFVVSAAVYAWYPVSFTGEWVEAATGVIFLGVALITRPDVNRQRAPAFVYSLVVAAFATGATLGLLSLTHGPESTRVDMARAETAALVRDFAGPRLRTRCNIHKRLYTFMREYNQPYLTQGAFAEQVRAAGDSTRASYLLDPWNSPYWVRHKCADDRVAVFVYSFGPNRRRDSSDWEIGGDDVGVYLIER